MVTVLPFCRVRHLLYWTNLYIPTNAEYCSESRYWATSIRVPAGIAAHSGGVALEEEKGLSEGFMMMT